MEIIEIIFFHLNHKKEILEISFRCNNDPEYKLRESEISYDEIDDLGYTFHLEQNLLENIVKYEFSDFDDDLFVDENEILAFLNEFYILNSDKLPKATFL